MACGHGFCTATIPSMKKILHLGVSIFSSEMKTAGKISDFRDKMQRPRPRTEEWRKICLLRNASQLKELHLDFIWWF